MRILGIKNKRVMHVAPKFQARILHRSLEPTASHETSNSTTVSKEDIAKVLEEVKKEVETLAASPVSPTPKKTPRKKKAVAEDIEAAGIEEKQENNEVNE